MNCDFTTDNVQPSTEGLEKWLGSNELEASPPKKKSKPVPTPIAARILDNDAGDTPLPELRQISLQGGLLPQNLDEIELGLVEQQASLFHRNGSIVRPVRTALTVRGGETIQGLVLAEVHAAGALIEDITRHTILRRKRQGEWYATN